MTWSYRVIRFEDGQHLVHEVYYDDDDSIISASAEPIAPYGESVEEIRKDLSKMTEAASKPVIDASALPFDL